MDKLPWNERVLQLDLTDEEKGEATNLILELQPCDREVAVPKYKAVALASIRNRLAKASGEPYTFVHHSYCILRSHAMS